MGCYVLIYVLIRIALVALLRVDCRGDCVKVGRLVRRQLIVRIYVRHDDGLNEGRDVEEW